MEKRVELKLERPVWGMIKLDFIAISKVRR